MEVIEEDLEYINYPFDELSKKEQKIETRRYTSVRECLTNKITNESLAINRIKKNAQQYLTSLINKYNSIYNDSATLNEYFNTKRLNNNHDLTNVQESTRLHIEMSQAVEASEGMIADMEDEFITNIEVDISALQNSSDRLK
ncbi:hypothetical protein C922_04598 [Plasmodium inui San Antonio 1]|uniref:Uncharacterized protein n=1 Tax=Plasmodium inui San Antonio 1 TaxID=1237626 RepID=W7A077_9APIC|nr:hypothetical protein C922_04598 [Plasmodium inui San Antonio 1]EUD64970.1 hypothetical protein C922_04598 [Plasmodium inui San Antonio 1]